MKLKQGEVSCYHIELVGKDLFVYKQQGDKKHTFMHNLKGMYIKKRETEVENSVEYFPVKMVIS